MSSVIIRNPSIEVCGLPYPLQGVLLGGQKIKLNVTKAELLAACGGVLAMAALEVSDADDAGPFDTSFMGAVALIGSGGAPTAAELITNVKYLTAASLTSHMKIDLRAMGALVALTGGATQAEVDTRIELLRADALAHGAGVGTTIVDGEHKAADTTNDPTLAAIPPAVDLATAITLINGLLAWLNAHRAQAGVHFNNDGTVYTIPVDPPVTLADCIADANAMLVNFLAHFALGQPPTNA